MGHFFHFALSRMSADVREQAKYRYQCIVRHSIMPSVYLTTPGTRASIVSERLRVEFDDLITGEPAKRDIPLFDIERVVISENVALTIPALAELMRRGIPVVLTSPSQRVLGLCQPPAPHCVARIEQFRRASDTGFCLSLAVAVVRAKILNQRRVLQRVAAGRQAPDAVIVALRKLRHLSDAAIRAETLDSLRGTEGAAAGCYFDAWQRFLPDDCPFERRSRRPPLNPPNAVLSYAYTLITAEAETSLHGTGLDPAIGFFHTPADRRPSLALDLVEPFRAPLADAMTLDLFNRKTLKPGEHFEWREGGVFLNAEGRRILHVSYERRMEREFTSEQHGRRSTIRAELHSQARLLRDTLTNGSPFTPFLMN